ncbi:hypothetical protein VaNZ11_015187, partial [Volvox africanus]
LLMGAIGTNSLTASLRQRYGYQSMSGVVKTIQAELRDPDLHLEAMIAHGTFGAVYRGVWRGLPVAVKIMVVANEPDSSITEGRQARQRAVLEAAISLSMAHPNVVVTYSYDVKPLVHAPIDDVDQVHGDQVQWLPPRKQRQRALCHPTVTEM